MARIASNIGTKGGIVRVWSKKRLQRIIAYLAGCSDYVRVKRVPGARGACEPQAGASDPTPAAGASGAHAGSAVPHAGSSRGQHWIYLAGRLDVAVEVEVLAIGTQTPWRVNVAFVGGPQVGQELWIAPNRLKVPWADSAQFIKDAATWLEINGAPDEVKWWAISSLKCSYWVRRKRETTKETAEP